MKRALVVGESLVGRSSAEALAALGWEIETVSARALLAGAAVPGAPVDLCVLAHGKDVTGRGFGRRYDDILASRVAPMQAVLGSGAVGPDARCVLMSSTVACLGPEGRDLPLLQRAYEAAFLAQRPAGDILRLGAMRGPRWQIDRGLPDMARTVVLKRLRSLGGTDIPWADDALLADALAHAMDSPDPVRAIVAHGSGFDVNGLLDGLGEMAPRLPLPAAWFRTVYALLGAPRAFFRITTDDLAGCGWDWFDAPRSRVARAA